MPTTPLSGLTRFMAGRIYPGTLSKVKDIVHSKDGMRIIHLENGRTLRQPKAEVLSNFKAVLTTVQRAKAERSLRVKGGKAAVTIGGAVRGERKTFASVSAAKAAITRHYGKP